MVCDPKHGCNCGTMPCGHVWDHSIMMLREFLIKEYIGGTKRLVLMQLMDFLLMILVFR